MSTTATTTKKVGFAMPTGKEAFEGAKDLGLIAAGMIGAHAVVTMTKKDTAIVNGGIALVGFGAAVAIKNPYVRMIGLGMSAYGLIKLANNAVKEVATPGTTEGLNGLLPENVKSMIRKFIPTLSGMDEYAGIGEADDDIAGLSLDDVTMREENGYSGNDYENVEGLGEAASYAM